MPLLVSPTSTFSVVATQILFRSSVCVKANYRPALWRRDNVLDTRVSSPTSHLSVGNQFNSLRFYHALGFATGQMASCFVVRLYLSFCINDRWKEFSHSYRRDRPSSLNVTL